MKAATSARAVLLALLAMHAAASSAAIITVNSLADDIFPDNTGAIFTSAGVPIALPLPTPKCTLRMAIAAANLNGSVGGGNGCIAGSVAPDTIVFDAALNLATVPGTITLFSKAMSEAPASYSNTTALAIVGPLTITGPGASQLTLDGTLTAVDGRRMLVVSDGDGNSDSPLTISGVRFVGGRGLDQTAACMFSSESSALSDVVFEYCESIGGGANPGFGGAAGFGNVLAGSVLPAVSITNARFVGNRASRGTATGRSENGALFIGSGTRKVGAVALTNVVFTGNSAERHGAMLITNATSVTIADSVFVGNAATGSISSNSTNAAGNGRYGAFAVTNVSGDVTITGTRVQGNVAHEERGGFGVLTVGGTTTMDFVEVDGNYVNRGRIGGFEVLTDGFDANGNCLGTSLHPVVLSNMRVIGNSVASVVSGFRVICSGALQMSDSLISRNETRGYRLSASDTVSTGNSAGTIQQATDATAAQSTAALTRVQFRENITRATAGGGGFNIFTVFGLGAFVCDQCRFNNNTAAASGVLALNGRGSGRVYLVVNSEFTGNYAHDFPALFMETDGNYTLRNSTVSGNVARDGGSIVKVNANTNIGGGIIVAIEHSTIARNTANFEEAFAAGVWANLPNAGVTMNTLYGGQNAGISIRNSILGPRAPGYTGTNTVGFDATVTGITAQYSLLEWTGGAPAGICNGVGMKCNVGAMLNQPADNGDVYGPITLRTMAPMAGSPVIDAGGPVLGGLTTDQRGTGFPRVVGAAVDMGAHETSPATVYGCSLDPDGNGGSDALTDGLILMRALLGMTGSPVLTGATGNGATRQDWGTIRNYLNANCGTNFGP